MGQSRTNGEASQSSNAPQTASARGVVPGREAEGAGTANVPALRNGPGLTPPKRDAKAELDLLVASTVRLAGVSREQAEDGLGEAVLALLGIEDEATGAEIASDPSRLRGFLLTVARRQAVKEKKRARRGQPKPEALPEPSEVWPQELIQLKVVTQLPKAAQIPIEEIEAGRGSAADAMLSPDHSNGGAMHALLKAIGCSILTEHYDLSDEEISRITGRSVGAIRQARYKAKQKAVEVAMHLRSCDVRGPGCATCEELTAHRLPMGDLAATVKRALDNVERAVRRAKKAVDGDKE